MAAWIKSWPQQRHEVTANSWLAKHPIENLIDPLLNKFTFPFFLYKAVLK